MTAGELDLVPGLDEGQAHLKRTRNYHQRCRPVCHCAHHLFTASSSAWLTSLSSNLLTVIAGRDDTKHQS